MSGAALLRLEFFKSRRQHLFVIEGALLAFLLVYSFFDFSHMSTASGWLDTLYTMPLMDALLFPVVLAAIASRLCECEHKGNTFKLLETMMTPQNLFDAKLACGTVHVAALSILQSVIVCAAGASCGFSGPLPILRVLSFTGITFAVSMLVFALQLGLSLLLPNQMIPMTVGVAGSFLGIFTMFFPQLLQKFLPWGYYGVLMQVGMDWNQAAGTVSFYWAAFDLAGLALLAVWFAAVLLLFRGKIARREV